MIPQNMFLVQNKRSVSFSFWHRYMSAIANTCCDISKSQNLGREHFPIVPLEMFPFHQKFYEFVSTPSLQNIPLHAPIYMKYASTLLVCCSPENFCRTEAQIVRLHWWNSKSSIVTSCKHAKTQMCTKTQTAKIESHKEGVIPRRRRRSKDAFA